LADINIDTINPWGKTRDIEDLSNNNSTLDDLLTAAAKRNGRVMQPNSQPQKGSFYRADHFEFSKRGVPSLYTGGGKDFIGNQQISASKRKMITPRTTTIRSRTKLIQTGTSLVQYRMFNFCSKSAIRSRTATDFQSGNAKASLKGSEMQC
jgi:hypothetical protein